MGFTVARRGTAAMAEGKVIGQDRTYKNREAAIEANHHTAGKKTINHTQYNITNGTPSREKRKEGFFGRLHAFSEKKKNYSRD